MWPMGDDGAKGGWEERTCRTDESIQTPPGRSRIVIVILLLLLLIDI